MTSSEQPNRAIGPLADHISFSFHTDRFRPSIVAAINSAIENNPNAAVTIYCDRQTRALHEVSTPSASYCDLENFLNNLQTDRLDVAVRRMRSLALVINGGWYLDAFDTLTLKALPELNQFTIGEECWDPQRICTGVCASPKQDPFPLAWLKAMQALPDTEWHHWSDQMICENLLNTGEFSFDKLATGRLNWVSETGFMGELRLSEDQVAWLLDNAWVIHYFGRGALGTSYKNMGLNLLTRCADLNGWIPKTILRYVYQTTF